MNCIIIDNEQNIREGMKELLSNFCPTINLMGEAEGVHSGYKLIQQTNPQLIFLDVEMDDGTGIDLLSMFDEINFQVIFVTAHDKYAIKAFKFSAVDFILKPVDPVDLIVAVEKAAERLEQNNNLLNIQTLLGNLKEPERKKLVLSDAESIHIINVTDILSLKAEGSYTEFKIINADPILVSKNLKEYETLLEGNNFFRCHHSFLINLDKVIRFDKKDGGTMILENEIEVPVSVRKKELLLKKLAAI